MRNIKLTIEYDGKEFGGWQLKPLILQKNNDLHYQVRVD